MKIDPGAAQTAKSLVALCFRNGPIEEIHAGVGISKTGDWSDVFVIDGNGRKISWKEASRITQDEMKMIMKAAVNQLYHFLTMPDDKQIEMIAEGSFYTGKWDDPEEIK